MEGALPRLAEGGPGAPRAPGGIPRAGDPRMRGIALFAGVGEATPHLFAAPLVEPAADLQ